MCSSQIEQSTQALTRLRASIDDLNVCLLRVLEARGRTVLAIMEMKKTSKLPPFDQDRERQMLDDLLLRVEGPYSREQVAAVFMQVLEISRSLMAPKGPL